MQELLFFTQSLATALREGLLSIDEAKKLYKDYLGLNVGLDLDKENKKPAKMV